MSDAPDADALLQMAEHRGLKLVKSRRRKPGTGDYGKFGLKDAAGAPLLGIGEDGLTADAQDIAAYLRAGAMGTWQQSADATPDRVPPSLAKTEAAEREPPTRPATSRRSNVPDRAASVPAPRKAKSRPARTPMPPPPAPAPLLELRAAGPGDAGAIADLLRHLDSVDLDAAGARRNLADVRAAGGGLILAVLDQPVGCCGWSILHTLHRGPIGRITAIVVVPDHRRQGIARQLMAAAEQALADAGCSLVEAMSDIRIDNVHNYYRALDFDQTSYRFTRALPG